MCIDFHLLSTSSTQSIGTCGVSSRFTRSLWSLPRFQQHTWSNQGWRARNLSGGMVDFFVQVEAGLFDEILCEASCSWGPAITASSHFPTGTWSRLVSRGRPWDGFLGCNLQWIPLVSKGTVRSWGTCSFAGTGDSLWNMRVWEVHYGRDCTNKPQLCQFWSIIY